MVDAADSSVVVAHALGRDRQFHSVRFSYFVAAFLTRFHGMSVAQAGVWSGLGSGIAGLLGGLAVVRFGGRLRFAAAAALARRAGRVAGDPAPPRRRRCRSCC